MEVSSFYGGGGPREAPLYSQREVSDFVGVPRATLGRWTRPSERAEVPCLVSSPEGAEGRLSFNNLVEVFVLDVFRKAEGVTLNSIRNAVWTAQQILGVERPLLDERIRVASDVFWEDGDLVNLSRGGQLALKKVLESYLNRIEYEPTTGLPSRLYPVVGGSSGGAMGWERAHVVIDPEIAFGQPTVKERGISTRVIANRIDAGEEVSTVAVDYGIPVEAIEEAVVYERY